MPGYDPYESFNIEPTSIEEAVALIKQAKRPVILAGQGCMISRADEELMTLATTLNCPVTSTLLGKGVFPETHDLSLGMLGMHGTAYANKAMVECDLLLNVGSRFDDRIIGNPEKFCSQDAKIIHIDIDPAEMDKMIRPDVQIVGDAKAALTQLIDKDQASRDCRVAGTHLDGYKKKYPSQLPQARRPPHAAGHPRTLRADRRQSHRLH